MKHLKWLSGALVLTMLGACSDRDIIGEESSSNSGHAGAAVSGYIAVEIKLPQDVPTRAGDEGDESEDEGAMNDNYADGTPEEYKVHNAMIALFKGETESTATFYRAQDLKKPFFTNLPEDDPVSASYIAAIEVQQAPDEDEYLWALVVLNRNEDTTKVTTDTDGKVTFKLAGEEVKSGTTTFAMIKDYLTSSNLYDATSGFFMINAPMSKKKAGDTVADGDISYLTNLGNTVYDTPEQAKENVAGCVYVERAVAKVTCRKVSKDALKLTIIGDDGKEVDLSKDGWSVEADVKYALSNTSKKSYVIRNVNFSVDNHFGWDFAVNGRYRMLGNTPIPALSNPFHGEAANLYRTYWCKDPHYDVAMGADDKNVVTAIGDFKEITDPLYCKENTFQVKNQNYNSTTLAILEVHFKIKNGTKNYTELYVRDGNNSKVYLSKTSAYADGITRIIRDLHVQEAIKAAVVTGKTLPEDFSVKDHLDIKIDSEENTSSHIKYLVVKDIKLKLTDAEKASGIFDNESAKRFDESLASSKQTLLDGVNALTDVTVYDNPDGSTYPVAYYTVPIKHFGDYYTPWSKSDAKGVTTVDIYNDGEKNWNLSNDHAIKYLGRYGVVRNNWYEININKITALGSSVIPDSNIDLSDDNNEDKKYFAVEIHILSWAKRLQNVDL